MMKVASTSETSINFYHTTRRNNAEDSHLPTQACIANNLNQAPQDFLDDKYNKRNISFSTRTSETRYRITTPRKPIM
jgi:hypothetical protein